jgi:hypothetical protein
MSVRGGEAKIVDVSSRTAFPSNPDIDLTAGPNPMTASGWVFMNLHASVTMYVSDDPSKGELPVYPGIAVNLDSGSQKWWVRAKSSVLNAYLEWGAT